MSIDEIVGLMQRNGFVKVYSVNEDNAYRAVYKKRKNNQNNSIKYVFILDGINLFYTLYQVYPNLRDDIAKQFRKILKEEGKIYLKEPQK